MKRSSCRWLVILLTLVACGGQVPPTVFPPNPTTVATSQPARRIALGAWIPNVVSDTREIDTYTAMIGTAPHIVLYFLSWSDGGNFDPAIPNAIIAHGATPMLSWLSSDWRLGVDQPAYSDARIAAGSYDKLVHKWAHDLAAWGQPFYLRLDDEMNGDWDAWSPGVNGNTIADYIAMWRHIVDIFRQGGVTNVRFVWSPNVIGIAQDFTAMYPGDAYVDWIGLDGYNWGDTQPSGWQDFDTLFGESYDRITQLTDKPLMIPEIGAVEAGGDKAAWIRQAFLSDIPDRYPRIRAVLWFDEDRTAKGEADVRINTSPESLAAFREVARSPLYQGRLP